MLFLICLVTADLADTFIRSRISGEGIVLKQKNSGNDSRCPSPFYPADCVKVAPQRCLICCFFSVDEFEEKLHLHGLFFRTGCLTKVQNLHFYFFAQCVF